MKETLTSPPFTTFADVESIARNVASVSLGKAPQLGEKTLEVECIGTNIRWHQGALELLFSLNGVSALGIIGLEYGKERFVAMVLTFVAGHESLSYRMVTSHKSETDWLRESTTRIGRLLNLVVSVDKSVHES